MAFRRNLCALLFLLAGGCASLAIEVPRHVTLEVGAPAEIVGTIMNTGTPVGGVDVAEGHLPEGLVLEHRPEADDFAIRGVPSETGRYEIDISVWTYGTNFPGKRATARLCIDVTD